MRKNKKLILISSILATTAIAVVPAISIVNNIDTVNVIDNQLDNVVQNNEQASDGIIVEDAEANNVDSNVNINDSSKRVKADGEFTVDATTLEGTWGTNLSGNLIFTITDVANKTVSVKAEDPTVFTATDFNIKDTIINNDDGFEYTVTSIGARAFQDCLGLASALTLPATVTIIDEWAFSDCYNLNRTLTIPASVTSIGDEAFRRCINFNGTLSIPANVTSIGTGAFYQCEKILGLDLSNATSLTTIGESAFNSCTGLMGALTIPASVTAIGDYAFYACEKLTSAVIPNGVTTIGSNVFIMCFELTSVIIPESVTSIGDSAFNSCSSLTGVTIPESVTSIGASAFSDCSKLGTITIPANVTTISNFTFGNCNSLISVTIPASVTSIGGSAFSGCSALTGVTIPANVTTIGDYAFSDCSGLKGTLTIPASVTSIGDYAFDNTGSTDFKFLSENPPTALGTSIFGTDVTKTLWVPSITAKANYEREVIKFGLRDITYIKVSIILPDSVNITLSSSDPISINLNDTGKKIVTATAQVLPLDAANKNVTWSIDGNPNWLAIDAAGNISTNSALSLGSYRFQVRAVCQADARIENTAELVINVTRPATTKIDVSTTITSQNIILGDAPKQLTTCTATITPTNANPDVAWSVTTKNQTTKPDWLDINSSTGVVSTNAPVTDVDLLPLQTYVIKATATDGSNVFGESDFILNFTKPAPTDIAINGVNTSQTVKVNETLTLNPTTTITPDYASTDVAWSLSDTHPSDMIIDPATGKITFAAAMKHANTTYNFDIIAKSTVAGSLIQGTFSVQLKVDYAIVTSVAVGDIETFDLELGQDVAHLVTCTATVNPNPGTSQVVTWSIVSGPSWISINANSGAISVAGTTDESLIGAQTITVKAISQQNSGQSGDKDFTINFTKHISTNDLNLPLIIGATVGGAVVVLATIAGTVTYVIKRNKKLENK